MMLFPTPIVRDYKDGQSASLRDGKVSVDTVGRAVMNSGEISFLQTPQVDDAKNTGHNQERRITLASEVWLAQQTVSWGKYELAIRRWEEVIGRAAPAPTKPDGKNDAHRLSADFVEWLMGLPAGWVCDPELGLKRNDQLKALGNGVVPQQAEMALRFLIDDQIMEQLGK
jgi:site-specific DNA-cytosine methylase